MRRLKYPTAEAAQAAEAAAALEAFAGVGKPKRKPSIDPERYRKELRGMLAEDTLAKATPAHLVALYEYAHENVYGVRPAELSTRAVWRTAMFSAARLLREEFNGEASLCVDFIRWTWKREKAREHARRKGTNASIGRIGWRLQFVTRHLVTDYRVDVARSGGNRG